MKTVISVPDPIFEAAEDLAKRLGMSRSELFTTAVKRFIDFHDDEAVTRALNEIYSESTRSLDPVLMQMQFQSLPDEAW